MKDDPVRTRLRSMGASEQVIAGGLEGLITKWETFAKEFAVGYKLDIDSYRNDVDVRQLIGDLTTHVPNIPTDQLKRIHKADHSIKQASISAKCVWSDAVARKEGWTPEKNWWYFMVPKNPGEELREDLEKL